MKAFTLPTIFTALDKFSGPVNKMSRKLEKFASISKSVQKNADSVFDAMGGRYVGYGLAGALGLGTLAVKSFVNEASKIEDAAAFFTPVLGSAEKADKLVEMLNNEAANTPFVFKDLTDVASQILPQMNGDLEKTIKTFRMLGDTAGGDTDKLRRITLGYNKALLKGKVTLESLNIIAEAGVPIFTEMAKSMNLGDGVKGTQKLFDMISKGKVPVEEVTKAFEKMTSKGGMFYQGMITASKTFTGISSTLEDNIAMTGASIGKEMLPILKEYALKIIQLTDKIRAWVSSNKELIRANIAEFMKKAQGYAEKLGNALVWVYKNIDTIVYWGKKYIEVLIAFKAMSFAAAFATNAMTVAMFFWRAAIFLSRASVWGLNAVASVFFLVDMVKYVAATRGLSFWQAAWAIVVESCTGAMAALNAVMLANPIGLIIIGIVALIAVIVAVVKWYDEWGAAVTFLLGPLGMVINLIMAFKRNWDMITKAFKEGGVLEGFKAIGKTILDAVLMPLEQIVSLIADITGADWAKNFTKNIHDFRANMGVNVGQEEKSMILKQIAPVQSAAEQEREMVEASGVETLQRQHTTLTIDNKTGNKISTQSDNNLIDIKMGSTMQYGL